MKNKLTVFIAAIVAAAFLPGCASVKSPRESVPANTIALCMTNGTLNVVNPKSNEIIGMDITVNPKTGEYRFHADSIKDAMDANVVTMSGKSYADTINAQGQQNQALLKTFIDGVGTFAGAAAKTAVKP